MSIYRTEGDCLEIMVRNVGRGSSWLTERRVGEELDCLGPQGKGFRLDPRAKHLLFVGGGYGVAPLVGLAERAIAKGKNVTLAVGAGTTSLVFPARLLPPQVEYLVATDDGSAGYHGVVTDLVPEWLSWTDAVCACGPVPMMAALAGRMRQQLPRTPGQVAMEERMGCSMGVCLGCVVETTKGPLRVCSDGPVFDIYQITWDRKAA
jgi:dihydroorotate dehydrogenase electron transfer subunit